MADDDLGDLSGPPETLQRTVEACHRNAEANLDAAELLANAGHDSGAFGHSVLALEEIGKAELLGMSWIANVRTDSRRFDSWIDDHLKKLFWCFWGPSFGREILTAAQVRQYQGIARGLHERRMASQYVTPTDNGPTLEQISTEEAERLIEIGRSRLALSKARKFSSSISKDRKTLLQWWLSATDDPDKRQFVFGSESQRKLVELGDGLAWMKWVKDHVEASEKKARQQLQAELAREKPSEEESEHPKWKIRLRLHTPSHSIRKRELEKWNEGLEIVQFTEVDKRPHELIADITLSKAVPMQSVWSVGELISRCLVGALNVGTLGFFWFTKPQFTAAFYEHVTDLEARCKVGIERTPRLEIDWGNHVLHGGHVTNVYACFAEFMSLRWRDEDRAFLDWYFTGLSVLAKVDVHVLGVPFVPEAWRAFYTAWKFAAVRYGHRASDADFPVALGHWIEQSAPSMEADEREQKYVQVARCAEQGRHPDAQVITLSEVGCMKILCDLLIVQKVRAKLGLAAPDPEDGGHEDTGGPASAPWGSPGQEQQDNSGTQC